MNSTTDKYSSAFGLWMGKVDKEIADLRQEIEALKSHHSPVYFVSADTSGDKDKSVCISGHLEADGTIHIDDMKEKPAEPVAETPLDEKLVEELKDNLFQSNLTTRGVIRTVLAHLRKIGMLKSAAPRKKVDVWVAKAGGNLYSIGALHSLYKSIFSDLPFAEDHFDRWREVHFTRRVVELVDEEPS